MADNRIDAALTDAARTQVLTALDGIRTALPFLEDLGPEERQELPKLGPKSYAFARLALDVARQNPDVLPRAFDLDAFGRDVALLEALEPVRLALNRLAEHVGDTRMLVGSEAYLSALEVYRYVKGSRAGAALDGAAGELGRRFARRNPPAPPEAPPSPPPAG